MMEHKGKVLMEKYELGRLLGQGTFAKVYYARNLETSQSVAVKVIDKEKILKAELAEQTLTEVSVMRLIKHPNVLELYEVMATKTKIYFIMEYAKGGELFNKLAKGRLREERARKYFQQLISAVDFCHSRGVYHRDLKPENLLLDENGTLKVSDFGLSALSDSKKQDGLFHTTCGTPAYVAPEIIRGKGYDGAESDIWSCGVILYVLLAGYLPLHDSNLMAMYRKISKGDYAIPSWFSTDVRKLLTRILDPNPKTRVSLAKIMDNPWFKKRLNSKPIEAKTEVNESLPLDGDKALVPPKNDAINEPKRELIKPAKMNAFDIISLSTGFDLSGLFVENNQKGEAKFTTTLPASNIISKLEDIARELRLHVTKKERGMLKLERLEEGRKGGLSIDADIYELSSSFHLVEMKKAAGDTLEYHIMLKQDIRPALEDIVWAWQGEEPRLQHYH
uniref:non-specific serine/threonine protein kinase n=1 Tax=Nitraria tangutorum TaxID=357929 RepID=S5FEF6_9ROSI|nr:CBL-interacting protein kinase 2 [Nitraria tangutorum]